MIVTRLHRLSALALASLALAACQPEFPKMTPEETQRIDALTARVTPRCVGRYLIDLPEDFVLNPIHGVVLEGVEISIKPMTRDYFDIELKDRREVLMKERIMGENTPSLTAAMPLSDGSGYVFNRSRTGADATIRALELLAWRDGYLVLIQINATDMSLDTDPMVGDTRRTDIQEKLDHLLKIYSRVRGRADHEVPEEPGVCFANGFLQGEPTEQEQVDLNYHLKTAEDVYFTFHSRSDLVEHDTLLERRAQIEKGIKERNGATLRKGKRESHGVKFEEWLMSLESEQYPGLMFHDMTLEANSTTSNAATPLLIIDLDSGVRHPGPPLTLEQAAVEKPLAKATFGAAETIALWDKATATLRMRPANGPATPAKPVTVRPSGTASADVPPQAVAPKLPLGTVARSLQRCPQTGLWECAAELAAGELRRRYYREGMTLPTVIVRGPERGLLQKLKGEPPNRLVETTWTLVSYDLPPRPS